MNREIRTQLNKALAGTLVVAMFCQPLAGCGVQSEAELYTTYDAVEERMGSGPMIDDVARGEEIFRGVFFGLGPVADLFPEYWSPQAQQELLDAWASDPQAQSELNDALGTSGEAQLAATDGSEHDALSATAQRAGGTLADARSQLAGAVIDRINQNDPGFFSTFAAEMTSGDPQRVHAVLATSETMIVTAVDQLGLRDPGVGSDAPCSLVAVCVANFALAINIVVALNVIAVAHIAVAVAHIIVRGKVRNSVTRDPLERDVFIAEIATRLAAQR